MSTTNDSSSLANATLPADMEAALHKAFIDAPTTLSYTPTSSEKTETESFTLWNDMYCYVEAYLKICVSLSATDECWEEKFTNEEQNTLNQFNHQIYPDLQKLQECLVNIQQYALKFGSKTFSRFHEVSLSIVTFCDMFAKYVEGKGCLRDQIVILSDESTAFNSPKFLSAVQTCEHILNTMAKESKSQEAQWRSLVVELTEFHATTEFDDERLMDLYPRLIGPRPDGTHSYFETLNRRLEEIQQSLEYKSQLLKKRDSLAIAMDDTLSGIHDEGSFRRQVAEEEAMKNAFTVSIFWVMWFHKAFLEIAPTMNVAARALNNFTVTFSRLADDLQTMGVRMNDILEKVREEEPFIRALANTDLEEACSKWTEVRATSSRVPPIPSHLWSRSCRRF